MTESELIKRELELSEREVKLLKEKIIFLESKESLSKNFETNVIREAVYVDQGGGTGINTVDFRGVIQ